MYAESNANANGNGNANSIGIGIANSNADGDANSDALHGKMHSDAAASPDTSASPVGQCISSDRCFAELVAGIADAGR